MAFKTLKFILTCGNQSISLILGFLILFYVSGKLVFSNSLSSYDNVLIFWIINLIFNSNNFFLFFLKFNF